MLYEDKRPLEILCWALEQQVLDHLPWKQYVRTVVSLNAQRYFYTIMSLSLKLKWQSYLKNTMSTFEEQQQNIKHIHTAFVEAIKELALFWVHEMYTFYKVLFISINGNLISINGNLIKL